jgi:hypothetical protein
MAMHPSRPLTAAELHQRLAGARRLLDPHQIGVETAAENLGLVTAIFPGAHAATRLLDLAQASV